MTEPDPGSIREIFDDLVPGYDQFNSISSLGFDDRWRKKAALLFKPDEFVLDVGTGTGQMARMLAERDVNVIGLDFSEKMITTARKKWGSFPNVSFAVGAAQKLPFESTTFDGITSAFVLRNLFAGGVLLPSFREFYRVLKPEGQMVHLELTRPTASLLAMGHKTYLNIVLPILGKSMFGSRWPKQYLSRTIKTFPGPDEILQKMRWVGFDQVRHYPLSQGIAGLFIGMKC